MTSASPSNDSHIRQLAADYVAGGVSVVPIKVDGTKQPARTGLPGITWSAFQDRLPTQAELDAMFGRRNVGIAVVGGAVSGNMEIIDIDDPELVAPYLELVERAAPGLVAKITNIRTPRPGLHLIYRCNVVVPGNTKLAQSEPVPQFDKVNGEPVIDEKTEQQRIAPNTLIETRGWHGYAVTVGSPAVCHHTGRPYEHVAGPPLTAVATITAAERDVLWTCARSFNRLLVESIKQPTEGSNGQRRGPGKSPGDDFAERATWDQLLSPHGWTVHHVSRGLMYWTRPGKGKALGSSATTGIRPNGADLLVVFSSSAYPFDIPSGQNHSTFTKFAAFAILNHGGDYSAAAKTLAANGYGDRRSGPPRDEAEAGPADDEADPPAERNGHPKAKRKRARRTPKVTIASGLPGIDVEEGRTDLAQARRVVNAHGCDIRYCHPWAKWLWWDGKRWAPDATGAAARAAKKSADDLWERVAARIQHATPQEQDAMLRYVRNMTNARGIGDTLIQAKSEPGIPIMPEQLDCDPMLLNVLNGTLDLRTAELRSHQRSDYLTKLCPVRYDPEAQCPLWLSFLDRITPDLIEYVRRAVGCSLTGKVLDHVLFFLWGTGANGKTTFIETILALLGEDYSTKANHGLLLTKRNESHPTELARLAGKRFVAVVEAGEGRTLAEALVKEMTGGDKIAARRMREDFWEFRATHKTWLAANHKPTIRGTDQGIWRRVKLLPFTVTIPEAEQDKTLPDKLKAELPGILNWALQGCMEWQADGLNEPAIVTRATADYRSAMDVVGVFVAECCIEERTVTVRAKDIYAAYRKWCEASGEDAANQRRFGEAMTERGYDRFTRNGTWYSGVGLASERTEGTERTEPYSG